MRNLYIDYKLRAKEDRLRHPLGTYRLTLFLDSFQQLGQCHRGFIAYIPQIASSLFKAQRIKPGDP